MANADDVVDDVPDGADIGALADTLVDRGRAVLDQFPAVADSARDVLAGALMDNGGRANSTRRKSHRWEREIIHWRATRCTASRSSHGRRRSDSCSWLLSQPRASPPHALSFGACGVTPKWGRRLVSTAGLAIIGSQLPGVVLRGGSWHSPALLQPLGSSSSRSLGGWFSEASASRSTTERTFRPPSRGLTGPASIMLGSWLVRTNWSTLQSYIHQPRCCSSCRPSSCRRWGGGWCQRP